MPDLEGRTIAITGASSGIGRAAAVACADAGMRVALMARREDRLRELAAQLPEERSLVHPGSVDDPAACAAFIERAADELGPVFAVFANAGYGVETDTASMPDADLRRMFEVNFYGSLSVINAALPGMIERGEGHALLCSSCLSKIALPRYAAYGATKAAQEHFGRAMRIELAPRGVAVSTVHPVGTRTEFFDTAAALSGGELRLVDRARSAVLQPPERVARAILKRLRSGRGGEVWTSPGTRTLLATANAMPWATDRALAWMYRRRRGATDATGGASAARTP